MNTDENKEVEIGTDLLVANAFPRGEALEEFGILIWPNCGCRGRLRVS